MFNHWRRANCKETNRCHMYKDEYPAWFGCRPQTEPATGEDTSMMEIMALQDTRLKPSVCRSLPAIQKSTLFTHSLFHSFVHSLCNNYFHTLFSRCQHRLYCSSHKLMKNLTFPYMSCEQHCVYNWFSGSHVWKSTQGLWGCSHFLSRKSNIYK